MFSLYNKLLEHQDLKYRDFQAKLIPNIPKDSIIGVRTPILRNIAKEYFNNLKYQKFLDSIPHKYFEENLIHSFIISMIKDFDECISATEVFLPHVDCWPVSDQAKPKIFTKNHQELLPYIIKWINSTHTYTARFGIRMLMSEFLGRDFKNEYLDLVAAKKTDDYYLKMMIAWFFATALTKQYDQTIQYIKNRILDSWIHNKTIQKAIESYRISNEHKDYLKTLKIKSLY